MIAPSLFQRPMIARLLNPPALAGMLLLTSVVGCASTPEEVRAENAIAKLNDGFASELDRLLQRWSAAQGEANRTASDVYSSRLRSTLKRQPNLDAAVVGVSAEDPSIAATCCAALGFASHAKVPSKIKPGLKHEHPGVRGNAALGLWLQDGRGCKLSDVVPLLTDSEAVVRQQGALLVARVLIDHRKRVGEDQAYYDGFIAYEEALDDRDEMVRVNVAKGLGEIGNAAAATILLSRGLRDKQPRVRYEAAKSLAVLKPAAAAEDILETYDNEFNRHVRAQLTLVLQAVTGMAWENVDDWKRELPRWRAERARAAARKKAGK